jgi:hypothetical protein
MSASFKTPVAVALTLAASLLALPALSAPSHDTGHVVAQRRVADFAEATAYVSPATSIAQASETDGLSRKDDECNFGCIDH